LTESELISGGGVNFSHFRAMRKNLISSPAYTDPRRPYLLLLLLMRELN